MKSGITGLLKDFYKNYIKYYRLRDFRCEDYFLPNSFSLDLGCGKTIKNPFKADFLFGVDVDYGLDGANIFACDLGVQNLPFQNEFFDYVTAFDLIEHIPRIAYIDGERCSPFIYLMNEISRVLKPNGIFLSNTPAYPRLASFSDPTHVNIITVDTFEKYFSAPHNWAMRYGYHGNLSLDCQFWDRDNLISILRKK